MSNQTISESATYNRRVAQRKRCLLPVTELVGAGCESADARNLSASGIFLKTGAGVPVGTTVQGRVTLPLGIDPVGFAGEVVHRVGSAGREGAGVGVRFREVQSSNAAAWTAYLLGQHFAGAVKQVQRRVVEQGGPTEANLKPLRDPHSVLTMFDNAARRQAAIEILWGGRERLQQAFLAATAGGDLLVDLGEAASQGSWARHDLLYGRLQWASQWFYFESYVVSHRGRELRIIQPEVVLFEERRVEPRGILEEGASGVVEMRDGDQSAAPVKRRLLDVTASGFSFVVDRGEYVPEAEDMLPALTVRSAKRVVSDHQGRVVYVEPLSSGDVRVGVQFRIDRCPVKVSVIEFPHRRDRMPFVTPLIRTTKDMVAKVGARFSNGENKSLGAQPVRYRNEHGQEIAAFVSSTTSLTEQREPRAVPVVIVPPAFARRKETAGLLALTLVESFRHQRRDIVVIRFDGINSVGESSNAPDATHYGEMVHYTLSQLVDDIRETMRYVASNPFFRPTTVTLVTFSMASIAARRFLAESAGSGVRHWISCMGASDADDLMRNSTGGIDYLADFERGQQLGVKEVLGQLVNLDRFCSDAILNRMAYLDDARRDLRQISTAVTWIYGKYDYWINRRRVLDVMSLRTTASRNVYEVPCGHIVRTGDDALEVFGLITRLVWRDHHGTPLQPRLPSAKQRLEFERAEWGRIEQPRLDLKQYWRSYLLGAKPEELGFDILTLTDEYLGLMDRQIDLLEIHQGEAIVDLGGGTGNFGLRYLDHVAESPAESAEGPRIIAIDFVRGALQTARVKHRQRWKPGMASWSYLEANLDLAGSSFGIPLKTASVSKVLVSLFLSYVQRPVEVLRECSRILRPGGLLIASTLLPDTDMSLPVHRLVEKIKGGGPIPYFAEMDRDALLIALQSYINSAAYLTDLEERKLFRFFSASDLEAFVTASGFSVVESHPTFGSPPQGVIVVARRCAG